MSLFAACRLFNCGGAYGFWWLLVDLAYMFVLLDCVVFVLCVDRLLVFDVCVLLYWFCLRDVFGCLDLVFVFACLFLGGV